MVALILIAAALGVGPVPTLPQQREPNWQVLTQDGDGSMRFDPASVVREGKRVTVAVRVDLAKPMNNITRLDTVKVVDCAAGTSAFRSATAYDASGKQLGTRQTGPDELSFQPITDESGDVPLREHFCTAG
jgi:hypothetical protein